MLIYDELNKFEQFIDRGVPIFGFLRVVEYKSILEKIKIIENSLPQEILQNRVNLIRNGQGEIFNHIESMLQIVDRSFRLFGSFVVIDPNKIFNLVNKIYAEIPYIVQSSRDKTASNNEQNTTYLDIEIPDFLKRSKNQ